MAFSFIHISDIHLSRPFSGLSKFSCDDNVLNIYKTAVEKAFRNAINFAIENNVDFVLISGDTFDSGENDFSSKLILKQALTRLENADIKTFIICGNHDPAKSFNKTAFNFDNSSNIKISGVNCDFNAKFVYYSKDNSPEAVIHTLSFRDSVFNENPVQYFSKPDSREAELFNIGLLHCALNDDKSSPYAPCSREDLKSLNYDYWALGHIHVPCDYDNNIKYAGSIQGRNTKETGAHGIRYIKVNNGIICENSFVPMDVIRFDDINVDLSVAKDITDAYYVLTDEISAAVKSANDTCELYLLRINLTGQVKFYNEINDDFINTAAEKLKTENNFYISQITNSTSPLTGEDLLKNDEGISGGLYNTLNNDEIVEKLYSELECKFKNITDDCNYTLEEYNLFKQRVISEAKEKCLYICSEIYKSRAEENNE